MMVKIQIFAEKTLWKSWKEAKTCKLTSVQLHPHAKHLCLEEQEDLPLHTAITAEHEAGQTTSMFCKYSILQTGMWKRLFRQPLPLLHLSLPLPTEPGL